MRHACLSNALVPAPRPQKPNLQPLRAQGTSFPPSPNSSVARAVCLAAAVVPVRCHKQPTSKRRPKLEKEQDHNTPNPASFSLLSLPLPSCPSQANAVYTIPSRNLFVFPTEEARGQTAFFLFVCRARRIICPLSSPPRKTSWILKPESPCPLASSPRPTASPRPRPRPRPPTRRSTSSSASQPPDGKVNTLLSLPSPPRSPTADASAKKRSVSKSATAVRASKKPTRTRSSSGESIFSPIQSIAPPPRLPPRPASGAASRLEPLGRCWRACRPWVLRRAPATGQDA